MKRGLACRPRAASLVPGALRRGPGLQGRPRGRAPRPGLCTTASCRLSAASGPPGDQDRSQVPRTGARGLQEGGGQPGGRGHPQPSLLSISVKVSPFPQARAQSEARR